MTATAQDRTRLERELRRLRADDAVETIYHDERAERAFDMTYSRRLHALGNLARSLVAAAEELRRADADPDAVHATDADLEAAFRRLCTRRLAGRHHISTGVIDSLEATREALEDDYELELDRTDALQAAIDGDRLVYASGASRARR